MITVRPSETHNGRKLANTYRKPFDLWAEGLSSTKWLPSSYPGQSLSRTKKPLILWHDVPCGIVLERHGRQKIVDKTTFLARQSVLDKKVKQPRRPRIQEALRRAHELKIRLVATPCLTRAALAREIGVHPGQLTRLLQLNDLAPEIQRYIMAMPLCLGWGPITGRALRPIALCRDREDKIRRFSELFKAKEVGDETIAP